MNYIKDSRKRYWASGLTILLVGISLFAYNNCAGSFSATSHGVAAAPSLGGGLVTADSITAYRNTLHPVLVNNCAGCHGASQSPLFAVADASQSLTAVLNSNLVNTANTSNSRLVLKINAGHQGFPVSLATTIKSQIDAWLAVAPVVPPPVVPAPTPVTITPGTSLEVFTKTVHPWLVQQCAGCHSANQSPKFATQDAAANRLTILNLALVNAVDVTQSRLVTKLRIGHQAFINSDADEIQELIRLWVNNSVGGIGNIQVLMPTFKSIQALILDPKCVSCHGATKAEENVRYDTYQNTLRTARAGDPSNSKLYTECRDNKMPINEQNVSIPLSSAELAAIRQWIQEGALNN